MTKGQNHRRARQRAFLLAVVAGLLLVPVAAIAAGGFDDVADDNMFVSDIQWMKDAGIVRGCNPPANTDYCPESDVTREQLAAFLHRVAKNRVVDAGTVEGLTAAELKGQQGDPGPQGEPGVLGFYTRSGPPMEGEEPDMFIAVALCDPGDLVTGGGYDTGGLESEGPIYIFGSYPNGDEMPAGWTVYGFIEAEGFNPSVFFAYAVCADITP